MTPDSGMVAFDATERRSAFLRELLARNLSAQGMFGFAFLGREAFLGVLAECRVSPAGMGKYDAANAKSVIVAALRYGDGEYEAPAWALRSGWAAQPEAWARIARFARANWYEELSERLRKAVAKTISEAAGKGIVLPPSRSWHRLVNSGLPEKPMAERAGLGWIGRNGILIAASSRNGTEKPRLYSSAVVLGLLLCPIDLDAPEARQPHGSCGTCHRCVAACPSGALGGLDAPYKRERCIQHWTALDGPIPPDIAAIWEGRLYGCDSCLEACPYFLRDTSALCGKGHLGPALPAEYFIENDNAAVRRDLSGSALGLRWMSIEAFRRNARQALFEARGRGAGRGKVPVDQPKE